MTDHDVWLAAYRREEAQVWCSNPRCQLHDDGADVEWESEYGIGRFIPGECWECGAEWVDDKPVREDD